MTANETKGALNPLLTGLNKYTDTLYMTLWPKNKIYARLCVKFLYFVVDYNHPKSGFYLMNKQR